VEPEGRAEVSRDSNAGRLAHIQRRNFSEELGSRLTSSNGRDHRGLRLADGGVVARKLERRGGGGGGEGKERRLLGRGGKEGNKTTGDRSAKLLWVQRQEKETQQKQTTEGPGES